MVICKIGIVKATVGFAAVAAKVAAGVAAFVVVIVANAMIHVRVVFIMIYCLKIHVQFHNKINAFN